MGLYRYYLLLETGDRLLLEDDSGSLLLENQPDTPVVPNVDTPSHDLYVTVTTALVEGAIMKDVLANVTTRDGVLTAVIVNDASTVDPRPVTVTVDSLDDVAVERFRIKEGMTYPTLDVTLTEEIDDEEYPVNVTGATVTLYSRNKDTQALVLNGVACSVVDGPKGKVRFTFTALQSTPVAVYEFELNVDFGSGVVGRFPTKGYMEYEVVDEIA